MLLRVVSDVVVVVFVPMGRRHSLVNTPVANGKAESCLVM